MVLAALLISLHIPFNFGQMAKQDDLWVDSIGLIHRILTVDNGEEKIRIETVRRWTVFEELPDRRVRIHLVPFLEKHPFIYYVDINHNGRYEKDEMFLDRFSDGINGNEEYLEYLLARKLQLWAKSSPFSSFFPRASSTTFHDVLIDRRDKRG